MTRMPSVASGSVRDSLFVAAMPWLFVLIWSTGFIVAKYGVPCAEPIMFLFLHFVGVLMCLLPLVWLARVPVPRRTGTDGADWTTVGRIAVTGLLMQQGYLVGIWVTVKLGMPARVIALIIGMQPVLTTLYVSIRGERVSNRQQLGLLCGTAGVGPVVVNKLHPAGVGMTAPALCVGTLLSITIDTLYQKRHYPVSDLRMGVCIQFGASVLSHLPFMFLFETREVYQTLPVVSSLVRSVLTLSIGAISLLFVLIRGGTATKVTSLLYLTPPTTAMMARALLGERFPPFTALGMVIAACGVALVIHK